MILKLSNKYGLVNLLGLDFGSTTSSALVATAHVAKNCITGKMEFNNPCITFRSDPVFTPFDKSKNEIQEDKIIQYINEWLLKANLLTKDIFSGGVLITGLAAKSQNCKILTTVINKCIGDSVIATADDPNLESWLAFKGNTEPLTKIYKEKNFVNLDIGGGTTNIGLGRNGQVISTGCLFVGARHFQFEPGTYNLTYISPYGVFLLNYLGIFKSNEINCSAQINNCDLVLEKQQVDKILDFYMELLISTLNNKRNFFNSKCASFHEQVSLKIPNNLSFIPTFSGGVGELIYTCLLKKSLPDTTYYGDLGIDLAKRIAHSSLITDELKNNIEQFIPKQQGRATVYGLALNNTEVSGTTLFISNPEDLPLKDIPIVGNISYETSSDELTFIINMALKNPVGGCVQIKLKNASLNEIKVIGEKISILLKEKQQSNYGTLIFLVPRNLGHALGNYITDWQKVSIKVLVIDEIPERKASFVNVGTLLNNVVPVSFYGFHPF